jgi:hypothetical protein
MYIHGNCVIVEHVLLDKVINCNNIKLVYIPFQILCSTTYIASISYLLMQYITTLPAAESLLYTLN